MTSRPAQVGSTAVGRHPQGEFSGQYFCVIRARRCPDRDREPSRHRHRSCNIPFRSTYSFTNNRTNSSPVGSHRRYPCRCPAWAREFRRGSLQCQGYVPGRLHNLGIALPAGFSSTNPAFFLNLIKDGRDKEEADGATREEKGRGNKLQFVSQGLPHSRLLHAIHPAFLAHI